MPSVSFVTGTVLITATLISAQVITGTAQARVGCCLMRETPDTSSPWLEIDKNFDECQRLNRDKDGDNDNIFKPRGKIWWSIEC